MCNVGSDVTAQRSVVTVPVLRLARPAHRRPGASDARRFGPGPGQQATHAPGRLAYCVRTRGRDSGQQAGIFPEAKGRRGDGPGGLELNSESDSEVTRPPQCLHSEGLLRVVTLATPTRSQRAQRAGDGNLKGRATGAVRAFGQFAIWDLLGPPCASAPFKTPRC